MVRVIELLRNCEQETGTRLVTFDFEILFHLYVHGPSASMTLLEATSASLAAFVKAIKRLTEQGLLVVEPGTEDRRVRDYDLSADVRDALRRSYQRHFGAPEGSA